MIVIKNGILITMEEINFEKGDIAIDGDKIVAVAKNIDIKDGDIVIDAEGKYITPGLIEPHCHLGMWESGMGVEGADGNEMTDPVTPQLKGLDGVNPTDPFFKEALEGGITTAVTGPGSANVIGGQFVALKTHGNWVDKMVLKEPAAMKSALGENPKRVYHTQNKTPMTRMAVASIFREMLLKAINYKNDLDDPDKDIKFDYKMESLLPVIDRKLIIKTHSHRVDDIVTAIRLQKEFDLNMTIDHCSEGHLIPEILKEAKVKPIVGPLISSRGKVELKNVSLKAPSILAKNGIKYALMTDHPVIPIGNHIVQAALTVKEGVDKLTALKSITLHAAQFTGIDHRVGSLKVGKDGDVVIWSKDPLDIMSKVENVFIDGKKVL